MKQAATTFYKDSPAKFSKRMASPMETPNGHIANKAAGNNDVGSIIKAQFNSDLQVNVGSFAEQLAKENR